MEEQYESPLKRVWRRFLVLIIIAASIIIGMCIGVYIMQQEAIKHGSAGYDQTTGAWGWKDSAVSASKVAQELAEGKLKEINKKCKALGSKKANDPECILIGE